jgi:hypothetical protein
VRGRGFEDPADGDAAGDGRELREGKYRDRCRGRRRCWRM